VAIAHVQNSITTNWSNTSPGTLTLNGVTAGNSLIFHFANLGTSMVAATSVTDNLGNTWVKLEQTTQNTTYHSQDNEVWWVQSALSGNTTITVAYPGTPYGATSSAEIHEFSGIASVDVAAALATGTASSYSVTTSAGSATGDLAYVIGIGPNGGGGSTFPSSPWTSVNNSSPASSYPAYQIMPSTSAVTATWTMGGSYAYATIAILFKAAVSGYTVTFNANGGSGTMSPETHSSATALTANAFTYTGYTFAHWNTAADNSGTSYADGASYPFTASATLYAIWATTGVSSVSVGNLSVTATSQRTTFATSSVALGATSISATSKRTTFATSSIAIGSLSVSATSKVTVIGVSNISIGAVSLSATSTTTVIGTASVTAGNLSVTANSLRTVNGTVSVSIGNLSITSTGSTPSLAKATMTVGVVTGTVTTTGNPTSASVTVQGVTTASGGASAVTITENNTGVVTTAKVS
jgi:hypothetical protein